MKTNSQKGFGLFFLCFLILASCTPETPTVVEAPAPELPPLIQPPIPEMVQEFEEKEFDIAKGVTWSFHNGTRIRIPANALMDADSNAITGKATLKFRDYHDAADIFLSGIPMTYEGGNMQTAGMFELRAEVDGQPALLKSGMKADIRLASRVGDKGYNSYYLNEEARGWEDLGPNTAERYEAKRVQVKKAEELRPEMKFPLDRKYFALDYDALLDEYFKDNWKGRSDAIMKEKLEAYGLAWLDADCFEGVQYNGRMMPAALMVWKNRSGGSIPSWVKDGTTAFKPLGGNMYMMKVYAPENKDSTNIKVELVMPVTALFKLPPEEWANNYQVAYAKFQKEERRARLMTDFTRSMQAESFGIFNYDLIIKEDEALLLAADFRFPAEYDGRMSEPKVYYIPGTQRALISYPQRQWEEFPLMPDKGGVLFSLLPGNQIAIYPKKAYAKIDFKALKKQPDDSRNHQFNMVLNTKELKTPEELKKALLGG